jgi:hypothetical protein
MDELDKAQRYRCWADENVALAKAATSNQIRARHYAIAQHFHLLAEAEMSVATRAPTDQVVGLVTDVPAASKRGLVGRGRPRAAHGPDRVPPRERSGPTNF